MFRYSLLKNRKSSKENASEDKEICSNDSGSEGNKTKNKNSGVTIPDDMFLLRRGYILMEGNILGEGTYSKVKRAYSKHQDCDVAVKIVNRKIAPKDFLKRFLPRELEIIRHLNHPNICKFYEVLDIGEKVFIVMQHATKGDLLEYIQKIKFIQEDAAKLMFLKIVSAVSYLHDHNILHRDLKCENILLTKDYTPLLTDFGFAKHLPNMTDLNKTYCGSSAYAPLEILKGTPYNGRSAEVWSLGCILYIITTGSMPFDDSNKPEQMRQMKKGPNFVRIKQSVSELLKALILLMLDTDPARRISLNEVKNNIWCTGNFSVDTKNNV